MKKDSAPTLKPLKREIIAFLVITLLIITSISCRKSSDDSKPKDDVQKNFNQDLAIPDFSILTIDSTQFESNTIKKDGIILIKYFSPDCDNCQEEAALYHSKKDSLKNIRTIWISGDWADMQMIKEFTQTYNLKELNPIVIGKETNRYLINYYNFSGIPFAALYKDNQLLKDYKGKIDFEELIDINYDGFIEKNQESETKK